MYSREFTEAPEQIVKNGKAQFGTFSGVSPKIDIKGMRAPYAGVPLPAFLTKIKIKSRLDYVFSNDKYIGLEEFYDYKIFGLAELIFWNKETGKRNVYHTITSPRKRLVPKTTSSGICGSYSKNRYMKVVWRKNHQYMGVKFDVKGDSVRPSAKGGFFSPSGCPMHTDSLFVCPAPASSRCNATWISTMNVKGAVSITASSKKSQNKNEKPQSEESSPGLALLMSRRTYLKRLNKATTVWGLGKVGEKDVIFQIGVSNTAAADPDKYNSNLLVVDGKKTALPSVVITHPFGYDQNWIIQDTESMIDLTFTPLSRTERIFNIIAFRFYETKIYGTFEGVLLTADGEKISLKNFPGIIDKNSIRM